MMSGFCFAIDEILLIRAQFSSDMKLVKIIDWKSTEETKDDHRIDG